VAGRPGGGSSVIAFGAPVADIAVAHGTTSPLTTVPSVPTSGSPASPLQWSQSRRAWIAQSTSSGRWCARRKTRVPPVERAAIGVAAS
jgi:hypothetical protein